MTKFAFVIHPISGRDVARKYPIARLFPESAIEAFLKRKNPMVLSEITGIKSKTGATTEGIFIGLPLTPRQMVRTVPIEEVYQKIIQCAELAEREGAKLLGLGAFSAVVGDGGITVATRSPIAITTGNSYTVATAIEGLLKASKMVGIQPEDSTLAVIGATGSIGKTCALVLRKNFKNLMVIGRDEARTIVAGKSVGADVSTTDVSRIREADAIISVTSSESAVVMPEYLRPGAVVCDVSRPRDVSVRVAKERPDVLVIEGGVVRVPGDVDFHFNFGFPEKTAFACMSETMMLALEDRPESYTTGKDVSVSQVEEMAILAIKHGFELAGFRSFEKQVGEPEIDRARTARQRFLQDFPNEKVAVGQ